MTGTSRPGRSLDVFMAEQEARDPVFAAARAAIGPSVTIANAITVGRARLGLSQTDLALRLGTTKTAVSRLENARYAPRLETLLRLADILGLTIELAPDRAISVSPAHADTGTQQPWDQSHHLHLWLARAQAAHIERDPVGALAVAAAELDTWVEPGVQFWVVRWRALLEEGAEASIRVLTALDWESASMQNMSPFGWLVSQEERDVLLAGYHAFWASMQGDPERLKRVVHAF